MLNMLQMILLFLIKRLGLVELRYPGWQSLIILLTYIANTIHITNVFVCTNTRWTFFEHKVEYLYFILFTSVVFIEIYSKINILFNRWLTWLYLWILSWLNDLKLFLKTTFFLAIGNSIIHKMNIKRERFINIRPYYFWITSTYHELLRINIDNILRLLGRENSELLGKYLKG